MMKRTLILVAVLALALGCGANAFLLQTSARLAGGASGGVVQIGDPASSTTGWVAPLGEYLAYAAVSPANALLTKELIKPMPEGGWDFKLWGTPGLAATEATLKLWVQNVGGTAPTGTLSTGQAWEIVGPGGQVWQGVLGAAGSETAALATLVVPIVKTADPLQGATYIIRPFTDVVIPEPGSMLALGSGLIGLIGFGIRRRK